MNIILDIDGTLINSSERHYKLLNNILKKNNVAKTLSKTQYLNFKKNGGNNIKYMVEIMGLDEKLSIKINTKWIEDIEKELWIKYDILYEDSIPFLEKVKKENKIYYLSSRSNPNNLINELEKLNIKKFADEIFVVNTKNQIEEKRKVIKQIKENNKELVMIGDTEVDYYSAKENNIDYFILNRGFRSKEYFDKINIKTYDGLSDIFKELKRLA